MSNEIEFIEGLYPREKHERAPDFVLCKLSIKVDDLLAYLTAWKAARPGEEWINADLNIARSGKGYAKLDTWKPDKAKALDTPASRGAQLADFEDSDIPF